MAANIKLSADSTQRQLAPLATMAMGHTHCKKGIVIMTDNLLFQIQLSKQNPLLVEENHMT